MSEKKLQQQILKAIGSDPNYRLFRNNVGMLLDAKGNPVRYGLCKGSSDLIGMKKIKITPEMVGIDIAQFVSIEIKAKNGKLTHEQKNWLDMVNEMGGLGFVIYE